MEGLNGPREGPVPFPHNRVTFFEIIPQKGLVIPMKGSILLVPQKGLYLLIFPLEGLLNLYFPIIGSLF